MATPTQVVQAASAAQAAYAAFSSSTDNDPLALQDGGGDFAVSVAQRFLGIGGGSSGPFDGGVRRISFQNDGPDGFSATVFRFVGTDRPPLLAIRGTSGPIDVLQDAQLLIKGVASSQFISLYRYYRRLTTPIGEQVQYTSDDKDVLHRLNDPAPSFPSIGLSNTSLDIQLALDMGLGVLQPGEPLTVTGHSLGGHLALLFGRAFPLIAENVYTFNSPGISAWGNALLSSAGLFPNDPSRVINVVSDFGTDVVTAYGTRPGPTYRIFNEAGGPTHNHSIAQLSDSLALYDLLGKLSPGLADRIDAVSRILAAASGVPAESLEKALDMLGRVLDGGESITPIATTERDQAQRDAYYTKLYDLRDRLADGYDWGISSLAGVSAASLRLAAATDAAHRHALAELTPFVATGASFDDPLDSLSEEWLAARADFLANLLQARTEDSLFVSSGSPHSSIFVDVAQGEQVALLNAASLGEVEASPVPLTPEALAALPYDSRTIFGADDAGDTLTGAAAIDYLFGGGGDDALAGNSSNDLLEGGDGDDSLDGGDGNDELIGLAGEDLLTGGNGYDIYVVDGGDTDRIVDTDGRGEVLVDGDALTGGYEREDGTYVSAGGQHVYALTSGNLTIDGTLRIEQFVDGDLGIYLAERPDLPFAPSYIYYGDLQGGYSTSADLDEFGNPIRGGSYLADTHDWFFGRPGYVLFDTRGGNDFVTVGFDGDNKLLLGSWQDFGFGGEGNDIVVGGADVDFLLGGRGQDTLFAESESDDIETVQPMFDAPYYFLQLDLLAGGDGADVLIGSGRPDYVEGGAQDDEIVSGAGDDLIYGDGYALSIDVQEQYDVLAYNHETGPFILDATNVPFGMFHPEDTFDPPVPNYSGPDIFASLGPRLVLKQTLVAYTDSAAAGDDFINTGSGNDEVFAGGRHDRVFGATGNDSLDGGAGDDTLVGEAGDDALYGRDGNDLLMGGIGQDDLFGDAGDDTLLGGDGAHIMAGGPGADFIDPGNGTVWVSGLGDGDTLVLRGGKLPGQVFADAAFPGAATIQFSAEISPEDLVVVPVIVGPSPLLPVPVPGWHLTSAATDDGLIFLGDLAQWSGLSGTFADGTVWSHDDFVSRVVNADALSWARASTAQGSSGSDFIFGAPGDDTYSLRGGGHDSIADPSGTDSVGFHDVRPEDASVYAAGDDYVLRYPGGELRLVGQALPGQGVESISFLQESVVWQRADLDARAVPLADPQIASLGVQVARVGEAFSFEVSADDFGQQYTLGTTSVQVSNLEGGALPEWLAFDAGAGRLSGTPAESDAGVMGLVVALQDNDEPVAATSLVISVEASAEEEPTGGSVFASLLGPLIPLLQVTRAIAGALASPTPMGAAPKAFYAPTVAADPAPIAFHTEALAADKENAPVSSPIESLFSAPATWQAPDMLAAYAAAIEEFEAQGQAHEVQAAGPPPTDEEMAQYNATLHAWLDEDRRRFASLSDDEAGDYGGSGAGFIAGGIGIDRFVGAADQTFARPGLPGLPAIHAQPGLREGLADLGG